MPIRTNRGRAAVYRRLWGWPLRSGRHLITALVGLVVVAVAIAVVTTRIGNAGSGGEHPAAAGASISITPEAPTSIASIGGGSRTPPVTTLASPPVPMSAPASPAALSVIQAWGRAWVNHPAGMTNAQWLAQLKPYTTDEFLPVMGSVDVANIDATEVTGPPRPTKSFVSSVEALLPTNAGELDITAIATPQGWQVSTYTEGS